MRPDVSLATKTAPEEVRDNLDLVLRYAQHDRDKLASARNVLGGLEERKFAGRVPTCHRDMRLHLVVMPIGGGIHLLDLDGAVRETLGGIADR